MKNRTIEEIHDKWVGHRKFAWFVDHAIQDNHTITEIKEYNEKYKFLMDNVPMEFDKNPKANANAQLQACYYLLEQRRKLECLPK